MDADLSSPWLTMLSLMVGIGYKANMVIIDYHLIILHLFKEAWAKQFDSLIYTLFSDEGTKLEGETCGPCFSPSSNFTCGTCIEGLECVPDENAAVLPDLPSRCRSPQSKIVSGILNESNGDNLSVLRV